MIAGLSAKFQSMASPNAHIYTLQLLLHELKADALILRELVAAR